MSRPRVLAFVASFVPAPRIVSLPRRLAAVLAALAVWTVAPAAFAGDESQVKKDVKEFGRAVGEAGRDVGRAAGEAGREIGRAGKEVGLEVADAAKKTWYKGKEVAAPLLEDMRHAARAFWKNVLERKDETLLDLRRKNEELKRRSGSSS